MFIATATKSQLIWPWCFVNDRMILLNLNIFYELNQLKYIECQIQRMASPPSSRILIRWLNQAWKCAPYIQPGLHWMHNSSIVFCFGLWSVFLFGAWHAHCVVVACLSLTGRCCRRTTAWTSRLSNAWAPFSPGPSTWSPSSTSLWAGARAL